MRREMKREQMNYRYEKQRNMEFTTVGNTELNNANVLSNLFLKESSMLQNNGEGVTI